MLILIVFLLFQGESEESSEASTETQILEGQRRPAVTTASSRHIGERFVILHYSPFKAV